MDEEINEEAWPTNELHSLLQGAGRQEEKNIVPQQAESIEDEDHAKVLAKTYLGRRAHIWDQ